MIRVRVRRCVRVSVLEPHISAFCFFALLATATAADTTMRVWTTAVHVWL